MVVGDQSEVEKHLAEGKKLLQEGQLSDALYHYAAAVGKCRHGTKCAYSLTLMCSNNSVM